MLLKLYIFIISFVIWCLILAYNTLLSFFCFFFIILVFSSFLLILRLEFLAYLIILVYLGGILVFFLFSSFMINLNYRSSFTSSFHYINNIYFFIFFFKIGYLFFIFIFNSVKIRDYYINFSDISFNQYGVFNQDSLIFTILYQDKWLMLIVISLILFIVIYGVVFLCYRRKLL